MYANIVKQARAKLDRIIAREGDEDGKRQEPWYLEMLIEDELQNSTHMMIINLSVPVRGCNIDAR